MPDDDMLRVTAAEKSRDKRLVKLAKKRLGGGAKPRKARGKYQKRAK